MEDLPKGVALEWRKWCTSRNYMFDHLSTDQLYFKNVNIDLTAFSTEDDQCPPQSVVDFITSKYSNVAITKKHLMPNELNINGIGHFGFLKEKFKAPTWEMFLNEDSFP